MPEHLHCVRFIEIDVSLLVHLKKPNFSMLDFIAVLYFYLWFCVVSLYQIIFVVNSTSYREQYGDNPLKAIAKQIVTKRTAIRNKLRIKFNLPPKNLAKPNPLPKTNKNQRKTKQKPKQAIRDPFVNQSLRQRNDYIEMRRNYLNQWNFDISHGQYNLHC